MSYFTEAELRTFATRDLSYSQRSNLKNQHQDATTSIFLSHSHRDKDLVEGLINYFATLGIAVYVDWQDSDMPQVTNRETAARIKEKIKELDLFVMLATRNAVASRWVPWELGVADQLKGYERIAIVPVEDPAGQFHGNEYCQLYRRLEKDSFDRLYVYDPGKYFSPKSAEKFLREKGHTAQSTYIFL